HLCRRIDEGVVVVGRKCHRVVRILQRRNDLPSGRNAKVNGRWLIAMSLGLKKELDSLKKSEILCDLCLVESEDGRAVIIVDLDFLDPASIDIPCLLFRHRMRQDLS